MLVLSRHENEEIHIGDDVKLTVVKLKGNLVRIGIEAPVNIRVVRGELTNFSTIANGVSDETAVESAAT